MDSFELSTDTYDLSDLRRQNRRKPIQPDDNEQMTLEDIDTPRGPITPDDDFPIEEPVQPIRRTTSRREPRKRAISEKSPEQSAREEQQIAAATQPATKQTTKAISADIGTKITVPDLSGIKNFFADGRMSIFAGVVLILAAAYMLVASISYIATSTSDQSVLLNSTAELLKHKSASIENTTGWFGAFLSHFLIYRWLGIGSFILIFYIGAVGLTFVKLCNFKFWSLTFKSLVSAVAVSLIAGLVTYGFDSPDFWGGEHGYYINTMLIDNASLWSAVAVSIAMLTALILIYLKPLTIVLSAIGNQLHGIRERMARRHDAAIEAAHRAELRQQAEREAELERIKAEKAAKKAAKEYRKVSERGSISEKPTDIMAEKPAPLDEIYSPLKPTVTTETFGQTEKAQEIETAKPIEKTEEKTESAAFVDIEEVINENADEQRTEPGTQAEVETHETPETAVAATIPPALTLTTDTSSNSISLSPEMPENAEDTEPDSLTEPDATLTPQISLEEIPMTVNANTIEIASDVEAKDSSDTENAIENETEVTEVKNATNYDPRAELSHYRFPGLELLNDIQNDEITIDEEEQEANKERITNILRSYGVEIASIKATIGPTITLYEIIPAPGVRIAKIKRLGDDVALNLAAMGIRIIAPIPGKGTIGMEVPNKKPQVVSIRSILSSSAYRNSKAQLPMALGTTISNEVYVADLAKMPHLLVAGATGMGKSVGLNTIIASLLYRKHPAELKFVLVDPKMVEFSLYKCIERHFLAKLPEEENAIITQPENVVATLNSLCKEMDDRYLLLSEAGMRGIKEYNEKFVARKLNPEKGHRFLPYIVVIIDEFADLILTVGKEVETPISRIAAKARAVGIHMILATQRPSVNVITGVIKANFPGRMAFRVTQRNDSQTILDRPGAEQLIGRGDMLISRDGIIDRVQCAFIDTPEVEDICRFISEQQSYPMAYELPELTMASDGVTGNAVADRDSMFADAGREVISSGIGSASSLQRKFNIGYPRAGKIIDQLEAAGVIGPAQGAKPRAVLMDMYSFERYLES